MKVLGVANDSFSAFDRGGRVISRGCYFSLFQLFCQFEFKCSIAVCIACEIKSDHQSQMIPLSIESRVCNLPVVNIFFVLVALLNCVAAKTLLQGRD